MTTIENNRRFIIDSEEDSDGGLIIKVTTEKNYIPQFSEAFYSIEHLHPLKFIRDEEIETENPNKSASIGLLRNIIEVMRKGMKTDSHIYSQKELDDKFELMDRSIIRAFERVSGIKFDHTRFKTLIAFQRYFQSLLKDENRKEGWI